MVINTNHVLNRTGFDPVSRVLTQTGSTPVSLFLLEQFLFLFIFIIPNLYSGLVSKFIDYIYAYCRSPGLSRTYPYLLA